jgi:hypothetical protein
MSNYSNRNNDSLPQNTTQINKTKPKEAGAFNLRIGYTTYRVGVYFNPQSDETARDKILRLVRSEAEKAEKQ